ncbi:MAG: DUF6316 family protein [Gammaproteobacteria bacterium]|nr:DUF6316 family protein [Gammaproteobacteria bacterium]
MAKRQNQINRAGEAGAIPPRRKRLFLRNNEWYYLTRYSQEHGPYTTMIEAKRDLSLFLRRSGVIRFTL